MTQLDPQHLAAWRSFITAQARLIERIDRDLLDAKCIPLQWYDVLIELLEAPERRLRMSELADRVVLSRSTITRLVDRLEAAGLLVRQRSDADRRGAYAVITQAGVTAMRQAWPIYAHGIAAYFGQQLSSGDAQVIAQSMARMLNGLGKPLPGHEPD